MYIAQNAQDTGAIARNRAKLISALQARQIPRRAGTFAVAGAIRGIRSLIPSGSRPGLDHTVEIVLHWNGLQTATCSCQWGRVQGPFAGAEGACRHVIIATFWLLPTWLRLAILEADYDVRLAWYQTRISLPADFPALMERDYREMDI